MLGYTIRLYKFVSNYKMARDNNWSIINSPPWQYTMPSLGTHMLVGAGVPRLLMENRHVAAAFFLGSIMPDFDMYGCAIYAIVSPDGREQAQAIHRTVSHSLVTFGLVTAIVVGFMALLGSAGYLSLAKRIFHRIETACFGMAFRDSDCDTTKLPSPLRTFFAFLCGWMTHITMDIFIWYAGVNLFWPFGYWVNLWKTAPSEEDLFLPSIVGIITQLLYGLIFNTTPTSTSGVRALSALYFTGVCAALVANLAMQDYLYAYVVVGAIEHLIILPSALVLYGRTQFHLK